MARWLRVVAVVVVALLIIPSGVIASTGNKTIEVFFQNIQLVVRGQKVTAAEEPFIMNGRTYVPLRLVAEALGEEVKWDGATNTIYVGEVPTGPAAYLTDIRPYQADMGWRTDNTPDKNWPETPMTMGGVKYKKGIMLKATGCTGSNHAINWNLNGQYTSVDGLIGLDDAASAGSVTMTIFGDDSKLATILLKAGDLPKPVNLNVKGVLRLRAIVDISPCYEYPYVDMVNLAIH